MTSLASLLTSLDGRIPRSRFWLGMLIIVGINIVLGLVLMAAGLRIDGAQSGTVITNGVQSSFERQFWVLSPLGAFILSLVTAAPGIALGVKRRKDRDFPGGDVIGFVALSLLHQLLGLIGIQVPGLDAVLAIWGFVLFIWLGVLSGTRGPNRYGPDPLAPQLVRSPPIPPRDTP